MRTILSALLLTSTSLAGCAGEGTRSAPSPLECGFEGAPASPTECKCIGGIVRYGIGPGPECEEDEEQLSQLSEFPGDAIPYEGAICCVPRD